GVRDHYVGVGPIEGGIWNIAMSIPAVRVRRARNDHDELFVSLLKENANLAGQFRRAVRMSPWLVSPLPRHRVRSHWPAGIIPLGNAAAALDPIGGEGMGLALRSAEMAVQSLRSDEP